MEQALNRLTLQPVDTSEARQLRPSGIRWGEVGIKGQEDMADGIETATLSFTLGEEADTIRWLHSEVTAGNELPLIEAESDIGGAGGSLAFRRGLGRDRVDIAHSRSSPYSRRSRSQMES